LDTGLYRRVGVSCKRSYECAGLRGLIDGRVTSGSDTAVDARVIAAVGVAWMSRHRCPPARCRLRRRVEQLLATDGVDPVEVMPSRATFYRLVERLGTGRHTFGSAPTRRSLAQRPDGPFGAGWRSTP
jgi:putative transposase